MNDAELNLLSELNGMLGDDEDDKPARCYQACRHAHACDPELGHSLLFQLLNPYLNPLLELATSLQNWRKQNQNTLTPIANLILRYFIAALRSSPLIPEPRFLLIISAQLEILDQISLDHTLSSMVTTIINEAKPDDFEDKKQAILDKIHLPVNDDPAPFLMPPNPEQQKLKKLACIDEISAWLKKPRLRVTEKIKGDIKSLFSNLFSLGPQKPTYDAAALETNLVNMIKDTTGQLFWGKMHHFKTRLESDLHPPSATEAYLQIIHFASVAFHRFALEVLEKEQGEMFLEVFKLVEDNCHFANPLPDHLFSFLESLKECGEYEEPAPLRY